VELWILPKRSANFLQIPGHNTCATYISFGSEPKQSPYIYHKCLCIYETTKTLGAFLHSQNFWNRSFAHCNQEDSDTQKQIQTQLKEKKTLRILQNFGRFAHLPKPKI
jgi:hypothetical protein